MAPLLEPQPVVHGALTGAGAAHFGSQAIRRVKSRLKRLGFLQGAAAGTLQAGAAQLVVPVTTA